MDQQEFRAGEIIFREGEDSDWAYVVVSGRVDIFKRMEKGTVLLATLGEGEIFGEMGVLTDQPRSASAAANTLAVVKRVSRDWFAQLAQGNPPEVVMVLRALFERLRETDLKLTQLASKHSQFQLGNYNEPPPITNVQLIPLTNPLKEQMARSGMRIPIPFRVGSLPEGEEAGPTDWNNLAIKADASIFSRNHFTIQKSGSGICIMDRGSRTGTIVNGKKIGGGTQQFQAELKPGENEIIVGDASSPYRFCLLWE